ncbi:MAG: FliA/WhiG family RNA polymerase sigma factor [Proteobacteria bacterium]|nr:FliA/WhiG family RNA polymerase sigma factor [Pseudomonadota bacterium]
MARTNLLNINEKKFKITPKNQNQIIMEFSPLIKYLAHKVVAKSKYSVEVDEMVSYGVLGLIDAISKYDKSHDNTFKTYAEFRIRGAMLDYLRDQDFVPRSVRDKIKLLEKTRIELEKDLCRRPTGSEIAAKLDISDEEYYELSNYTKNISFLSIEASALDNSEIKKPVLRLCDENKNSNPAEKVSYESVKKVLDNAITELPEREKNIVSMYYYDEMSMKEIAGTLQISESRASQLHAQAMMRLKSKLNNLKEDLDLAA